MQVLDFIGDLSDHCCIALSLKCNYTSNAASNNNGKLFPETFLWSNSSIMNFQSAFTKNDIIAKINTFIHEDFSLERHYQCCSKYYRYIS